MRKTSDSGLFFLPEPLNETLYRPLVSSRLYFLRVLEHLQSAVLQTQHQPTVVLAEAALLRPQAGDPPPVTLPFARFNLWLEGRMSYSITRRGQRETVTMKPGQLIYWPPHAVTVEHWDEPCLFLGVVFYGEQLRFLMADFPGGAPPIASSLAYHSSHTFEAPGAIALELLNALCAPADADADAWSQAQHEGMAGAMLGALLAMCCLHLQADEKAGRIEGRSFQSWRRIHLFLQENYTRPLSRDETARALGLVASHVSALCRRHAGKSFGQILEELRLERARYLLRNTGFTLERIAEECGYSTATYFIRVFAARWAKRRRSFATIADDQ